MVEEIPFGIAASILGRLGSSLFKEIGLTYGVNGELEKLKETLSGIQAKLLDAEERREESYAVTKWIRDLKDVIYDADDVLDLYATKARQHNLGDKGKLKEQVREFLHSPKQIAFRYKMGHRIRDIRERIDEIATNMSKFNFTNRVIDTRTKSNVRDTHSFVLASEVVGRDKNKERTDKEVDVPR